MTRGGFSDIRMTGDGFSRLNRNPEEDGMSDSEIKKSTERWQSDIIVDLIKQYGFPYIALNPGASYRGLHD